MINYNETRAITINSSPNILSQHIFFEKMINIFHIFMTKGIVFTSINTYFLNLSLVREFRSSFQAKNFSLGASSNF